MDLSAAHIGFVLAAYVLSFAVLAGLAAYIIARDRKLARQVQSLDRQKSHEH